MSSIRNLQYDGLRGIAVLIVLLSHTSGRQQDLFFWNFHGIGKVGVYLFFVLSAFLLTSIVLREGKSFKYGNYMKKRFFRIAPLYYLVLVFILLMQQNYGVDKASLWIDGGINSLLQHVFFYKGDSILWTIPIEFSFYFILPLLVIYLKKYQLSAISYQLSAISIMSFSMFILYNFFNIGIAPNILNIESNTQYLECFFIGVLAAFVNFKKVDINLWNAKLIFFNKKTLFILWLVLIVSLLLISKSGVLASGVGALFHLRSLTIIYAVVFGLTLIYISNNQISFFSNKFLVYTGKIGFSLYLLHLPIIAIVNKLSVYSYTTLNFLISMSILYLVAAHTFKYIELPFMKYTNSK